jgi:mannosyl-3-phosphoglycerate phosphatase
MTPLSGREYKAVVFTDMDGTLIDHHSYEFAPALPALEALKCRNVPLVLCSSKTRVELLQWQHRMGIDGPLIVENGGGIFLAGMGELAGCFPERVGGRPAVVLGSPYIKLRAALVRYGSELGVTLKGFGDMDLGEIAQATGLTLEEAALAVERDFDEPFLWEQEPDAALAKKFHELAAEDGLSVTRGGRFWHLMGDSDKGRAVRWVLDNLFPGAVSLGLGDSENDLEMLREVDTGVLVERGTGGHLTPAPSGISCTEGAGPVGWNRAVLEWLDKLPL